MVQRYDMLQHVESKNGKPPVNGIRLERDGLTVQVWSFRPKHGTEVTFPFVWMERQWVFTLRMSRKRHSGKGIRTTVEYTDKHGNSKLRKIAVGYTVRKCWFITAECNGERVHVPEWFKYCHEGEGYCD